MNQRILTKVGLTGGRKCIQYALMTSETIRRANLNQELFETLRDMIVRGDLPAGARVNEVHLAGRLGVSRTPLREALIALTREQFLRSEPRRGVFVAELTVPELSDLYAMRGVLDPFALDTAGLPSADQVRRLVAINDQMTESRRDVCHVIDLDNEWHRELLGHCRNTLLLGIIDGLVQRTRRYEYVYFSQNEHVSLATDQHQRILEAVVACDLTGAVAALRQNLTTGDAPVLEWLRKRSGDPPAGA